MALDCLATALAKGASACGTGAHRIMQAWRNSTTVQQGCQQDASYHQGFFKVGVRPRGEALCGPWGVLVVCWGLTTGGPGHVLRARGLSLLLGTCLILRHGTSSSARGRDEDGDGHFGRTTGARVYA